MSAEWGLNLACGHEVTLGATASTWSATAFNESVEDMRGYPKLKNGWYAAHGCDECGRVRRVVSGFYRFDAGGRSG